MPQYKIRLFFQSYLLQPRNCNQLDEQCLNSKLQIFYDFSPYNEYFLQVQLNPVLYTAFFDFGENGIISFLQVVQTQNGLQIKALYNNINFESFFIKCIGLNGSGKNFSPIYHGASFMSMITDANGLSKYGHVNQSYQTQNNQLQLPYAYQGLGISNSYIENLTFGMPQKIPNLQSWTPIIPKSQLFFNPISTDVNKLFFNQSWTIEIFVNPTQLVLYICFYCGTILIFLAAIIIMLHLKEKEEDSINHEQFVQLFG